MTSDSSSSTPMVLTPESTGFPDTSGPSTPLSAKKARRQTAFYPNMNSSPKPLKPFSRSAAKRESVMALGSIEHLQHYFTKTGIAAKDNPLNKPHRGLVPAIGGPLHVSKGPSAKEYLDFSLPPSPIVPVIKRPSYPQIIKTYETDPESLLPGVVDDLNAVIRVWKIDMDNMSYKETQSNSDLLTVEERKPDSETTNSGFDVLGSLKITTRAIRSIRNYVVSLPDESAGTIRDNFRSSILSSSALQKRFASQRNSDPLSLIRRSALEVLTVLRALEESSRLPLSDDAYDAQSDHGSGSSQGNTSHSRVTSPTGLERTESHTSVSSEQQDDIDEFHEMDASMSYSFIQVQGRSDSVPVWEEEEDSDTDSDAEKDKREHWDERLVLQSGWLYRQDVRLADLQKEHDIIHQYLDTVDNVLFGGVKDGRRGWERERDRIARRERAEREGRGRGRRVSAGDGEIRAGQLAPPSPSPGRRAVSASILDSMASMAIMEEPEEMDSVREEEEEGDEKTVDDEDLPEWAKRSSFTGDRLGRAHALLATVLPPDLLPLLPSPPTRDLLLQSLSSGQLLCVAYNVGIRRSKKPWGFISKSAIHDIASLEAQGGGGENRKDDEKAKTGWTFRRTDNLRLWAAALKLRYLIPILAPPVLTLPTSGNSTPVASPSPSFSRFPSFELPIFFDARLVARREQGWENMLESALLRWVDAVVEECRSVR